MDQLFVPGNVDDGDAPRLREVQKREADIDRHAALLLFGEAVRVDAGQGVNERRLSVIDVAGGAKKNAYVSTPL
jgi:hypothetical protein